jgi:preprotein translocase subunit SecA
MQLRHGSEVEGDEAAQGAGGPGQSRRPPAPRVMAQQPARREGPKIGRNDLCPCGSGQKFKKCHGASLDDEGGDDASA